MARLTANGAIVSDSGEWYYSGFRWKPLVPAPASKPPAYISTEGRQLAGLNQQRVAREGLGKSTVGQSGEELAALVTQHGSLSAAENALAETAAAASRPPNYGARSEDGRWWWDGSRWNPVPPA